MPTSDPRRAAFDILLRIDRERSYADILLDKELSAGAISGPDRGLLTELVYGVLRRRGTLDHVIDQFARQKTARMERSVLTLLRLGLYQILYLDRIPVAAAVNETVNLTKAVAPRATGLMNALLRRADRERNEIAYPDRERKPAEFLAARHSQPAWLVQRWLDQLGPAEAEELARVMGEPAPLTLRTNTLRISRDELAVHLAEDGVDTAPARFSPHALHLQGSGSPARLAPFRDGLCTVQDESSQLAALLLDPRPGEEILDLCAAPGGKATHLAQIMGDRGRIVACDAGERKLRFISENARRLGISSVETHPLDATRPLTPQGIGPCDRVLVDAPCSGIGVIRRNPEGKWWKQEADLQRLSLTQRTILGNAAEPLRPGGVLVYAVCSNDPVENEAVVDDFLSSRPDFVLEDVREIFPPWREICTDRGMFRSWPHRHGMDGFFAARMRKSA